jgi:hypothetical protein
MAAVQPRSHTCILVAGMHRSGTSATAGALGLCGVALGDELLAPGIDNPKGYFEHERAVGINERLLARLGSRWDDVRALPAGWQDSAAGQEALVEIEALIAEEFADAPLWALKDPRLCRLMPLWLTALRRHGVQPVALFVARDPAEVAASIQARNGWAPPLAELAWLRHMLEAEAASRGLPRTAIAYDALLADPFASLTAALARIGIALPGHPDAAALRRFVDAGDRHQRKEALPEPQGPFAAIIRQVRDALARIADGEDAWAPVRAADEAFLREWSAIGACIDAVAGMAAAFDAQAGVAREATAQVRSELNAQLDWARLAVEKEEALQADNARLQSSLTAQLAWSDAAVREREALQADSARLQSELTAQVRWSEQSVADWQLRAAAYEQAIAERDANLAAIHGSLSWRLAWPLRALDGAAKTLMARISGRNR